MLPESGSVVDRVPTWVPTGTFSTTLVLVRDISVGVSFTSDTVRVSALA